MLNFLNFKRYLSIYFSLLWVFAAASVLSLAAASLGFSAQSMGSGAQAQKLCHMPSLAPRARGLFPTRKQTSVPCTERPILNRWTTREIKLLKTQVVCGKFGFRKDLFLKIVFLAVLCGMQLLSSLTRDLTCILSSESTGFYPLGCL